MVDVRKHLVLRTFVDEMFDQWHLKKFHFTSRKHRIDLLLPITSIFPSGFLTFINGRGIIGILIGGLFIIIAG